MMVMQKYICLRGSSEESTKYLPKTRKKKKSVAHIVWMKLLAQERMHFANLGKEPLSKYINLDNMILPMKMDRKSNVYLGKQTSESIQKPQRNNNEKRQRLRRNPKL